MEGVGCLWLYSVGLDRVLEVALRLCFVSSLMTKPDPSGVDLFIS